MKADIYNQQKQKVGEMELSDKMFGIKWNPDLVHQAITAQLANSREPWAHAKGRGEVRGGGKKPWRQKGTGRARHGSTRSPIWVGGGITHGPNKERSYSKKLNKKMSKLAIFAVLSEKLANKQIMIVDKFDGMEMKTKEWSNVLKNLADLRSKTLVILENVKKANTRAISNIRNTDTISPTSINIYDITKHKNIIIEANAVSEMEKYYKV